MSNLRRSILAVILAICAGLLPSSAGAQDDEKRSLETLETELKSATGRGALDVGLEVARNYKFEQPVKVRELLQLALKRAQPLSEPADEAKIYQAIGGTHLLQENNGEAKRAFESALSRFESSDDQFGLMSIQFNLGVVARRDGRFADAAALYREALEYAEAIENNRVIGLVHGNLAALFSRFGLYEDALSHHRTAWRAAQEAGASPFIPATSIATNYARLGDAEKAAEFLALAQEYQAAEPTQFTQALLHRTRSVVFAQSGDWSGSLAESEKAYDLYSAIGGDEALAASACDIVLAKLERNDPSLSPTRVEECVERTSDLEGQPFSAIEARILQARFQAKQAEPGDAFDELLSAYEDFRAFSTSQERQQILLSSGRLQEELNRQAVLLAEQRAETAEAREGRQLTLLVSIVICAVLLLVLLALMMFFLRKQRHSNTQLRAATMELEERQQQLSKAVGQKDLLLQELNHRVKNNLQVVASLLGLERRRVESEGLDADSMRDVQTRVLSMASIHEGIEDVGSFDNVDLVAYITRLVNRMNEVYGPELSIKVQSAGSPLIQLSAAAPIGLILCELISNANEHAYPAGKKGDVVISLSREGKDATLSVTDTGVGLPKGFDLATSNSLGLSLVQDLAGQIGTAVSWKRNPISGVAWFLKVPESVLNWEDDKDRPDALPHD